MDIYQAVLLGIIQGLTEFLPVSSSGHLVIFQHLLGLTEPQLFFDISLHMGTLLAVILIYRKEIWGMIAACIKTAGSIGRGEKIGVRLATDPDARLLYLIFSGSIPTALIGLALRDAADTLFSSLTLVGIMMLFTGTLLWATRKQPATGASIEKVSVKKALAIGTVQGMAAIPGISRSGATISVGLFMGIDRETAARYSFLLSLPAIMGAEILGLHDALRENVCIDWVLFSGVATAFITGYIALALLLRIVKQGRFFLFAPYCWSVGAITIILNIITK